MADAPDVSPPAGGGGSILQELTQKKWMGIPIAVWFVLFVLLLALYLRHKRGTTPSNSGTVVPSNAFQLPYLGGYPITITSNTPNSGSGGGGKGKDKDKDKKSDSDGGDSRGVGPGPDPHFNMVSGTTTTFNNTTSSAPGFVNPPAPPRVVSVAAPAPSLGTEVAALSKAAGTGAGGSSVTQAANFLSMGTVPGLPNPQPQPNIRTMGPVQTVTTAVKALASIAKPVAKPAPVSGVSVNNMRRLTG